MNHRSLHEFEGQQTIAPSCENPGLIRHLQTNRVYIFKSILASKPPLDGVQRPFQDYENAPDEPYLSLRRWPRRLDFYRKIQQDHPTSRKTHEVVLPISSCVMDAIEWTYALFATLVPSIMRKIEIYLVADELSKGILRDVNITDLDLVVTAITASSANEPDNVVERDSDESSGSKNASKGLNYQRLEFLGDSILKLCTSVQLIDMHPLWPEGYLSSKKDRLVANSRLARAALEIGLDKYIITKQFTGFKWRPLYVDDLASREEVDGKRWVSSKVLADVCEALVGAAMVDGGYEKALKCLGVFVSAYTSLWT